MSVVRSVRAWNWGAIAIALLAFITRFWQLDGLAPIVFDEVYYAKFGANYLHGQPLFDAHPPLGKYFIALGIALWGDRPLGYRFCTALAGALVPLLAWRLADLLAADDRQLSPMARRAWPLWVGLFVTLDGLLLVESRYALINIYIVLFGLMAQVCLLLALRRSRGGWQRWGWAIAAGAALGAACSVKWSGVAYGASLLFLVLVAWGRDRRWLGWAPFAAMLGVVPAVVYGVQWLPHLWLNPLSAPAIAPRFWRWLPQAWLDLAENFWRLHQQILGFHLNLGANATDPVHPYCSSWWGWPWLERPIAYFYETDAADKIQAVYALGNPLLFWTSAIAILLCAGVTVGQLGKRPFPWLPCLLAANFATHYLPWSLSRRCTFLYHYLPASIFAFMAAALWIDGLRRARSPLPRQLGTVLAGAIAVGFVAWLPVWWGLPISPLHFRLLLWFPRWI